MSYSVLTGDCRHMLRLLPAGFVHTCVTSPPYFGLRDYGHGDQIGLEGSPDEFVAALVEVFREVRRVLRDDGTLWLNLGDSYSRSPAKGGSGPGGKNEGRWGYGDAQSAKAGSSDGAVGRADRPGSRSGALGEKQLLGIPWRVAFALQADGWYLRQDIIWHKPNPMPESVKDRCTKGHEYIFLLSKSPKYYFDSEAIKEPSVDTPRRPSKKRGEFNGKTEALDGRNAFRAVTETRNRRSVWTVTTKPYKGAHFATFPPDLIEPCVLAGCPPDGLVLAGCPPDGLVLDPFGGSGTTAAVAEKHGRNSIICEINPEYAALIPARVRSIAI